MHDITEPLRLAVGSHSAGSGKGCAMNLISWENGDTTITDLPACADPMLARIVQRINDTICTHRDGDLLCPACSLKVLDLGHRTVGTGTLPISEAERRVVWVKIATDQARAVLHLVPARYKHLAMRAIEAADNWTLNPCSETANAADAANAASLASAGYTAANAAFAAAAAAAANIVTYAAYTASNAAANTVAYAVYAAASNAAANTDTEREETLLSFAHRAFDLFDQLTEHARVQISAEQIEQAYACMTAT